MKNEKFASRVCELRKDKELSQKEFGKMLGVSNKAVSKWETGEAIPQMKTIIKMAEIFEISPDELLVGTKFDTDLKKENDDYSAEFGELKSENSKLRSDLLGANEKNKKVFMISAAICVAFAVVGLLFGFYFSNQPENPNDNIKSLGKNGTAIEFCAERFVPPNALEKEALINSYYYDEELDKYAEFIDENNKKSKILVCPGANGNYICTKQNDKKYIYINEKKRIKISRETLTCINLESTYNDFFSTIDTQKGIDYFLKYYNSKKEPENAKELTKLYFSDEFIRVNVEFTNYLNADIGAIFNDSKGNLYYYDYLTAKTYEMGGELFEYRNR